MDIHFVTTKEEFLGMGAVWDGLLNRSTTDVPFLRHTYLSHWWETMGGGEWETGNLWIGIGTSEGRIRGIAPLFFSPHPSTQPRLLLMGSIEISDYLDFITTPEDVEEFTRSLLQALSHQGPPGWSALDLYNLPESSPTVEVLKSAVAELGWPSTFSSLQPCPAVSLPAAWETYLAGLNKKQRHEIRRKIRRGAESGLEFLLVRELDQYPGVLENVISVMKMDSRKAAFLTPAMENHFLQSMQAALSEGWLQIALLLAGKDIAAAYLNFDYGNKLWVYNSALNPEYQALSAGWVLLGHVIRWGIDHQRIELDFMRGDERYKYRFGGVDRRILRVQISRGS